MVPARSTNNSPARPGVFQGEAGDLSSPERRVTREERTRGDGEGAPPKGGRPGEQIRRSLVIVGSAAVLTIYAAGYRRTEAAAQRFEAEEVEQRLALEVEESSPVASPPELLPPEVPPEVTAEIAPVEVAPSAPPAESTEVSPVGRPSPRDSTAVSVAAAVPAAIPAPPEAAAPTPAPSPAADSTRTEPDSTPIGEVLPEQVVATAPEAPRPSEPSPVDGLAPTAPSSVVEAEPTDDAPAGYKDGSYTGQGDSRHGGMEVTVEIEDGRIVSAAITTCWTRYPCSRISRLPPQVLDRQSADVDRVSGATQSANAYRTAVREALSEAM